MSARDTQVGGDHYKRMVIQPWDVIDTWPLEQRIGYYRGDALAYIMRMMDKNATSEDCGKAIHFLQRLSEVLKESEGQEKQFDLTFMRSEV